MQDKKGLTPLHGIVAFVMAMLVLLFGGALLIPLFGEIGAYLAGAVIALIGVAFTAGTKTKASDVFPTVAPPVRNFFGALLLYIGTLMANGIYSVIVSHFAVVDSRDAAIDRFLTGLHPAVAILVIAVLPAICEEFFSRGFLRHCLRSLDKDWLIIAVTAVMFGTMHLDLYSLLPSTMIGVLFGYVAVKTKSLIIPILLHFINNSLSVVLAFYQASLDTPSEVSEASLSTFSVGTTIGMVLFYAGIATLCFFFGYRLFHGKKLFRRPGVLVLILSLVVVNGGMTVATIGATEVVFNKTETLTYTESLTVTHPLTLEEGEYTLVVTTSAADPVEILLRSGDTVYFESAPKARQQVNAMLTLPAGEYELILRTPDGQEISGDSATYSAVLLRFDI